VAKKTLIGKIITRLFKNSFNEYVSDFLSGNDVGSYGSHLAVGGDNALKYSGVFGCLRVLAEAFSSFPAETGKKLMIRGFMICFISRLMTKWTLFRSRN
jgi:hypothetical protein